MDKILYISKGDPQVARAVGDAIEKQCQTRSAAEALRSKVAFQRGCVAMLRREGAGRLNSLSGEPEQQGVKAKIDDAALNVLWGLLPGKWEQFLDANALYMLRQMPKMIAVADQPYPRAYPALKKIFDAVEPEDGAAPNE
jgi:hypothetical protein